MNRSLPCLIAALALATPAYNCCSVTGRGFKVDFVDQANIIVWDPETHTEHFIRNAKFATKAGDLGFIAPTPTKPELAEVDPKAFEVLASSFRLDTRSMEGGESGSVVVAQIQDVAGFRATTVRAADPAAISLWMKKNGYVTSPSIEAWTQFYIEKKWYLTLFKVAGESGEAQTGLVRMTFRTDKPFNPYLLPKNNVPTDGNGRLALYFVAPAEYKISNHPAKDLPDHEWTGYVTEGQRADLSKHLKLDSLPRNLKVSAFADYSFPNPKATDDLYFERSGDGPQEPSSNSKLAIILGAPLTAIAVFLFLRTMANRKRY